MLFLIVMIGFEVFKIAVGVAMQIVALRYLNNGIVLDNIIIGVGAGVIWGMAGFEIFKHIAHYRSMKEMDRRIEELKGKHA